MAYSSACHYGSNSVAVTSSSASHHWRPFYDCEFLAIEHVSICLTSCMRHSEQGSLVGRRRVNDDRKSRYALL